MKKINETVQGLLLKDTFRKAGSREIEGKLVEWGEGYFITLLLAGGASASDIRKYAVRTDLEDSVSAVLADVEWGSLIALSLEDGKVTAVKVEDDTFALD